VNKTIFFLGMFMVCADFHGSGGKVLANSCRSAMLHYRGYLLDTLYKLVFSPFFVFGSSEEKQNIHVELFSDFEEIEVNLIKCSTKIKNYITLFLE
jgi:hypothetical protein